MILVGRCFCLSLLRKRRWLISFESPSNISREENSLWATWEWTTQESMRQLSVFVLSMGWNQSLYLQGLHNWMGELNADFQCVGTRRRQWCKTHVLRMSLSEHYGRKQYKLHRFWETWVQRIGVRFLLRFYIPASQWRWNIHILSNGVELVSSPIRRSWKGNSRTKVNRW